MCPVNVNIFKPAWLLQNIVHQINVVAIEFSDTATSVVKVSSPCCYLLAQQGRQEYLQKRIFD